MFFQNSIFVEGNLCQKPELKESVNGVKYCRFSVCYNQSKKDENGEWINIPHFFNVVSYKKTAESVSLLNKGDPVSIHGKLQYSTYEKNGEKLSSISISAESVKKLSISRNNKKQNQEEVSQERNELLDENGFPIDIPF